MSTRPDPLARSAALDRLNYATGMLLDAEDFQAEQLYHRARLARVARYLHGYGTAAGLRVVHEPAVAADLDPALPAGREERLRVQPGLAIDPVGRLIEVPRSACLRLDRWYQSQTAGELVQAFHGPPDQVVVADVFLRFQACEREKTPAFATGAFDALDAVSAARVRDAYELDLILRIEDEPPLPEPQWPDFTGVPDTSFPAAVVDAVLDAWREPELDSTVGGPQPLREHRAGQAGTDLLLARVTLPATGSPPERDPARDVSIDNGLRPISYASGLLAHLTL